MKRILPAGRTGNRKGSRMMVIAMLAGIAAGCAGEEGGGQTVEEAVPVTLCARRGATEGTGNDGGRTRTGEQWEAFTASVAFTTEKGRYTSLNRENEGVWEAEVSREGNVTWRTDGNGDAAPVYPVYPVHGGYLYLVACAPAVEPADGVAAYTLTGQEDLLYAAELKGCKQDGERFAGNTAQEKDTPLLFKHLLTRLSFHARKKQEAGAEVTITRITVNGAKRRAEVALATGETSFGTPSGEGDGLSLTPTGSGYKVTGTGPVELGSLMLPPLYAEKDGGESGYSLTVETSNGTYSQVRITYGETSPAEILRPGMSHKVTLTLSDHELAIASITVEPWTQVDAGDLGIGERNEGFIIIE